MESTYPPTYRGPKTDAPLKEPHDSANHAAVEDEHAIHHTSADQLARKLSARQVQMIAIGGTIGTGLFLGTGKSLATGGPASMVLSYAIVGVIVFNTMLALGVSVLMDGRSFRSDRSSIESRRPATSSLTQVEKLTDPSKCRKWRLSCLLRE